jgi:hypothetical protein
MWPSLKILIKRILPPWIVSCVYGANHSPANLPWFRMNYNDSKIAQVHRLAIWTTAIPKWRRISLVLSSLTWPLRLPLLALVHVGNEGGELRRHFGVSRFIQWAQLVSLGNTHNLAPESYYKFCLWKSAKRSKAGQFIQHHEILQLLPLLNRGIDTRGIDDKVRFFERCTALGLPTPAVVAVFPRKGEVKWHDGSPKTGLPLCDLFLKRADLYCGEGAERWTYRDSGQLWERRGLTLNESQLVAYCRGRSCQGTVLLQRRIVNHPEVARFSPGALCTLRVVTCRFPAESPSVLFTCWRMPVGSSEVDNFAAGGIAAPVDPRTGVLGEAVTKKRPWELLTHHPTTGARITGEVLPYFQNAIELSLSAHAGFGGPRFVGWDIALTDRGPIAIEGNTVWCVDLIQITSGRPLGETAFPDLLLTERAGTFA